ncbi:MAG: alpha/beta hydrolase [Rubrivivax sp.]|nr:alpha/beta hydrolase [Rubrivivax sp.]
MVWGRADPYIPVHQAELQRRSFDVQRVVVLERSGHWPMADDPDAVAGAVLPFLRARVGGAGR